MTNTTTNPITPYTTRPTRLEWLAFIGIILLAAALRMGMPGAVEFKQDEANLSLMALDMARGRDFPLLGIDSSVGVRNAPVNVYILALPYLLSSDPRVATQYIGLLNVIAVAFTYLFARRYYGVTAAIFAGVIFAAAPWSVMFSRKIWAQEMLPPFVVGVIFTGVLGFIEGKKWAQWVHLPLLAVTGQIHYAAFVLIPATLYMVWAGRKRLSRAFWLSIVLAGLAVLPYAVGAVRASLLNPETVGRILAPRGERRPLTLSAQAWQEAWLTIGGAEIHAFAGAEMYGEFLKTVPPAYPIFHALSTAVVGAALWAAARSLRRRDAHATIDRVLLLWVVVPPLAFTPTWTPMYAHYLIPMFPAAYILLGSAVRDILQRFPARSRLIGWGVFGATAAVVVTLSLWYVIALLNFLNTYATTGAFGIPLGYYMPVREAIYANNPTQVLAALDGQFVGYNEQASVWNVLLYDLPERRFLDKGMDAYPPGGALLLRDGCAGIGEVFPARRRLDNGEPEACFRLEERSGSLDTSPYTMIPTLPGFANGVRLLGTQWAAAQGCLETLWVLPSPKTSVKSDFFNAAVHFVNAAGERIGQADGTFWNGRYWRVGDLFTRTYCLADTSRVGEIQGVQLGLYTFDDTPDGRAFYSENVVDGSGAVIGQSLTVRFEQP
ncbi:MAG TPA: glycosyltransferase family 39 protein [Aggregatilineales bacterium]|nr:glycosyltransferase family 39 protein [Anaerolineales bacterium]HRE46749.1 glycosyltransferase family 39 protein [Aggregatilineales bacterium]